MSNQQKAEFVNDIFHIQSFCGGHGKILLKPWFVQEGPIYPEILIQQAAEFPIAATRKVLTIWSHLMDHQKFELPTNLVCGTSGVSAKPKPKT
jgi:hypothetical protein